MNNPNTGPRGGCLFASFGLIVAMVSAMFFTLAYGADLLLK